MDEVIMRHLTGETTDMEERRLDKWRGASPANEARFREVQLLWTALGAVRTRPGQRRPDIEAMLDGGERRRARSRARTSRRALLGSRWLGWGLAATAALSLAFVGGRIWWAGDRPGSALSAVESTAGQGQVVAMTLSDGSYVRTAAGTRLEFPVGGGRREVLLEGRAFFAVAHGGEPFVVETAGGQVTVVGTRFEVSTDGDLLRVVVAEGVVGIATRGGNTEVRAGQVATVRTGEAPEVITSRDIWSELDWPGGLLIFQRTSLEDVAVQLEHQFGVEVRIEDPAVASLDVTGSFRDEPLDALVETICAVTGISCRHGDDGVALGVGG